MARASYADMQFAEMCPDFMTAATRLTIGAASATIAKSLSVGRYRIVSTVACYINQGDSTVTAATATGHYLPADTLDYFTVTDTSGDYIAAITAGGGAGSLCISKQAA